jgi:hypothetical protein
VSKWLAAVSLPEGDECRELDRDSDCQDTEIGRDVNRSPAMTLGSGQTVWEDSSQRMKLGSWIATGGRPLVATVVAGGTDSATHGIRGRHPQLRSWLSSNSGVPFPFELVREVTPYSVHNG